MRISDWSSDVCSSDLPGAHHLAAHHQSDAVLASALQSRSPHELGTQAASEGLWLVGAPGASAATVELLDGVDVALERPQGGHGPPDVGLAIRVRSPVLGVPADGAHRHQPCTLAPGAEPTGQDG